MNKHKTLLTSGIPKSLASPKRFFWIEDAPCVGPIVVDGLKNLWRCVRFIVADVNFVIGTFVGEIAAKETFKASNSASAFIAVSASRVDIGSLTPTMDNVGASVNDMFSPATSGASIATSGTSVDDLISSCVGRTRNACVGRTGNSSVGTRVFSDDGIGNSCSGLNGSFDAASLAEGINCFVDDILLPVEKPLFFRG